MKTIRRVSTTVFGEKLYYSLGYYALLLQPKFRRSVQALREYKDRHRGERCFILGNGPSLNRTDLSLLRGEKTFGTNRVYLIPKEAQYSPTYYTAVNKLVIEQCAKEIIQYVKCPKFISYDARQWLKDNLEIIYMLSRDGPKFYRDVSRGVWQGATVTYVCMQLAYYMGFKQVILIGVDHFYGINGRPHETVVSQSHDKNHFSNGYFGPGFRWQLPDLSQSESAYQLADKYFRDDGRQIIDATIGGALKVFPKMEYLDLF